MITIRPSVVADAVSLADRLRPEDKEEVLAAGSISPLASLVTGVMVSRPCFTVLEDGTPQVMLGVVPSTEPEVGYVWLLASDIITRKPVTFMRQTQGWLDLFHQDYPILTNAVDARNTVHIKWLRSVGFTFIDTKPGHGPGSLPFHTFVRLQHV